MYTHLLEHQPGADEHSLPISGPHERLLIRLIRLDEFEACVLDFLTVRMG